MTEANLMRNIQVLVSQLGCRLFRNNVGTGWVGQVQRSSTPITVKMNPGDVLVRNARPLHAGLAEGSSDLIGWTPIMITEKMVGTKVAVFTAIEVKTEIGRVSQEQDSFLNVIEEMGGIALVARNENEAVLGLETKIGKK